MFWIQVQLWGRLCWTLSAFLGTQKSAQKSKNTQKSAFESKFTLLSAQKSDQKSGFPQKKAQMSSFTQKRAQMSGSLKKSAQERGHSKEWNAFESKFTLLSAQKSDQKSGFAKNDLSV